MESKEKVIAASCDLGTNTFRLLIAEIGEGPILTPLCVVRKITRLGGGATVHPDAPPVIQRDALERARKTLKEFRKIIDEWKPEYVEAIATHIVRRASNKADFSAIVKNEIGCDLAVVSPEAEAEYALLGALSILGRERMVLLMDIGGGSTEYILYRPPDLPAVKTTDLGVVTLTERFLPSDPPGKNDLGKLKDHIEKQLKEVYSDLRGKGMDDPRVTLVGTAGTVTTIAMMAMGLKDYRPEKINGYVLSLSSVKDMYARLRERTAKERLALPGLEEGREDVIVAGALLAIKSMEAFGYEEMTVSDGGILEGILLKGYKREVERV